MDSIFIEKPNIGIVLNLINREMSSLERNIKNMDKQKHSCYYENMNKYLERLNTLYDNINKQNKYPPCARNNINNLKTNNMKNEFKGTKGKWVVVRMDDTFIETDDSNVCEIPHNGIYNYKELPYNALLISKAPEMLDMLKRVLKDVDFSSSLWGNDAGLILSEEIEHLIESATKID